MRPWRRSNEIADASGRSLRRCARRPGAPPPEDVSVGFAVGPYFVGSVDYRVGSPRVGLNVSALALGGTTVVRASVADELRESVDAQFFAYSKSLVTLLNPLPRERWERWTRGLGDDLYPAILGREHVYALPTFLPANGRYLVAVSVSTGSQSLTQFAVVGVGEAANIPIGAGFPSGGGTSSLVLLLPAVALAGGSVAAVIIGLAVLRRRGRRPPGAPPSS